MKQKKNIIMDMMVQHGGQGQRIAVVKVLILMQGVPGSTPGRDFNLTCGAGQWTLKISQ